MEYLTSTPLIETRLETQATLYPTLRQLIRLLPCDHRQVLGYLQEEAKQNPFVLESGASEELGSREALLADVLPDYFTPAAPEPSLQEHLYGQISVLSLSPGQKDALIYLTRWLSKSGYLEGTPQAWAAGSPWSPAQLEALVPLLQSLDPPGIGARSLPECLLLQLKEQSSSLPAVLVQDYLEQVAACIPSSLQSKQSFATLLSLLRRQPNQELKNLEPETLLNAIRQIQSLEPRPARNFSYNHAPIVTPDLKVELQVTGWQVSLVYELEQRFYLNQEAIDLLTKSDRKSSDTQRLELLLQKAQSLLTALKQWQENILKVGQFLVERQQGFLSSGDSLALIPTPQQLVAQTVGLSNATVSRIVRGRYLLICNQPSRIIPLNSLCVPGRVGGRTPQQVQHLIAQLIQAEAPTTPYSDEKLAQLLKIRFGLLIARRTVTKYRQQIGLAPAWRRGQGAGETRGASVKSRVPRRKPTGVDKEKE